MDSLRAKTQSKRSGKLVWMPLVPMYCTVYHLTWFRSTSVSSTACRGFRNGLSQNRLRLNASKTEVIWLGSSRRLKNLTLPAGCALGMSQSRKSTSVRSLGVDRGRTLSLTFSDHISKLVNNCYWTTCVRYDPYARSLTMDSTHALVRANGAFPDRLLQQSAGAASRELSWVSLDGVMRAAARLVLQLQYRDHVTTLIRDRLHWLDAASRITYKLCVLVFMLSETVSLIKALPRWTLRPGRNHSRSIETSVRSAGEALHSTMSHRDAWALGLSQSSPAPPHGRAFHPTSGNLEISLATSKSCSRMSCSDKCLWVSSF